MECGTAVWYYSPDHNWGWSAAIISNKRELPPQGNVNVNVNVNVDGISPSPQAPSGASPPPPPDCPSPENDVAAAAAAAAAGTSKISPSYSITLRPDCRTTLGLHLEVSVQAVEREAVRCRRRAAINGGGL